jgi:hypothetical protein
MTTIFGGRFEGKDASKSEEDGVQGASLGIKGARNALCDVVNKRIYCGNLLG